jgi:hypothetical protein
VNALSVAQTERMFALLRKGDELSIVTFPYDLSFTTQLAAFHGSRGHILLATDNELLVSVDSSLILFKDKAFKTILKASKPDNFFWHATKFEDTVVIHEYGSSPTPIYVTRDLSNWRRTVSNIDLDKHSLHFHSVVYDEYRGQLIATLGDGNYRRAVCSSDGGLNWQVLFSGAWQFAPVVPLKDKIIFGMDSGFVRGGVGIYNPSNGSWKFVFLKWVDENIRLAQICDLKKLRTGTWIASLGMPQAVVLSEDLKKWYPLCIEGFNSTFNYYMRIDEGKSAVICSTGRRLLLFENEELEQINPSLKPVLVDYKAYIERLIGIGFILRRKAENIFLNEPKYNFD